MQDVQHPFEEEKNEKVTPEEITEEVIGEADASGCTCGEGCSCEESPVVDTEADTLKKELEDLNGRYMRLQADYQNSTRRARQEQEAQAKYRAQQLVTNLLPVLDNFERALSVQCDAEQAVALKQGVEMVYRGFVQALTEEGLEEIKSVGEAFDPYVHQAIMQVQDPSFESNVVVEELQKGYKLKDRVLRPSMVKVNE